MDDRWSFSTQETADSFDKHVRTQLPFYDICTKLVVNIARNYVPDKGLIYDLGSSTGNIPKAMDKIIELSSSEMISIEVSPSMIPLWKGPGKLLNVDVTEYSFRKFDVAICFLCLQFIPVWKRKTLLKTLKGKIKKGGIVILVDRFASPGGYFGTVMARTILQSKLDLGVSFSEIAEKELSLQGVQIPLDESELGNDVSQFFQYGDFKGFVIHA